MFYQELDKYYTKSGVVDNCLKHIEGMRQYDFVIEPSAGNGSFLNKIDNPNKIGIDLYPEDKNVIKEDWFDFDIDAEYKNVLIVGNPPFGRNHSLSDAFLLRSFSFSNVETIAFILPNTYRKYNRQKLIPANWRIAKIIELGRNSFTLNGKTRHCPCSFFVFDKSGEKDLRVNPDRIKTNDFVFSKKREDADFFIFGAVPGKVIKNPKKNNRGYFIKSCIDTEELIKRFQNIKWKGNSCANGGVAWFTKLEIIQEYNSHYDATKNDNFLSNDSNLHLPIQSSFSVLYSRYF